MDDFHPKLRGLRPQNPSAHPVIKLRSTFRDRLPITCSTKNLGPFTDFLGEFFSIIAEKCQKWVKFGGQFFGPRPKFGNFNPCMSNEGYSLTTW